jgi:hypothetical protein
MAPPVLPITIGRPGSSPPRSLPKQDFNAIPQQTASAEIPIASSDAHPRHTSRGFLPCRFAYAGPRVRRATVVGPPSANLHNSGHSRTDKISMKVYHSVGRAAPQVRFDRSKGRSLAVAWRSFCGCRSRSRRSDRNSALARYLRQRQSLAYSYQNLCAPIMHIVYSDKPACRRPSTYRAASAFPRNGAIPVSLEVRKDGSISSMRAM